METQFDTPPPSQSTPDLAAHIFELSDGFWLTHLADAASDEPFRDRKDLPPCAA